MFQFIELKQFKIMLFSLFAFSQSVVYIQRLNLSATKEIIKKGWTYILAAPSSDFEFPDLVRSFTRAAHLTTVQANFVVLDSDNVDPSEFNITQFPAQIFCQNGQVLNFQYRGFDEELSQAFINTNAVAGIPTLTTKAELDHYYSITSTSILIAVEGASSQTLPTIATFYRQHFSEIEVAFVKPELLSKPGWYIYRYLDGSLTEIEDLSTKSLSDIARIVLDNSSPSFLKFNSYLAGMYEESHQVYAILMLAMEDFYLTNEQLELARKLRDDGKINVTFVDLENTQSLALRYGIPDSLDSTLAIIDVSGERAIKYILPDPLTAESAIAFVKTVREGKAIKYWRSESDTKSKDHLTVITANNIEQYVNSKQPLVLAIYYAQQLSIEPYLNATIPLQKTYGKIAVFGKFSLMLNDWPIENIEQIEIPYIVIYQQGKIKYQAPMPEEPAEILNKLSEVLARIERDL